MLAQTYRSKILGPARINLFFKELFKALGIKEYEILFFLTCFLVNIISYHICVLHDRAIIGYKRATIYGFYKISVCVCFVLPSTYSYNV